MKKLAGAVALILAVVFAYLAYTTVIPDKYISTYGADKMFEYVGGDAYNYITEAALRGGEISGAYAQRAIFYAASAILWVLGLLGLASKEQKKVASDEAGAQLAALQSISGVLTDVKQTLHVIRDRQAEAAAPADDAEA